MQEPKLNVVLVWHMHQPWYRDRTSGEYVLPWVYLHALKDYHDMAAHIEAVPGARAVVNFVPTLLVQLEHYCASLDAFLARSEPLPDPMLAALVADRFPLDRAARLQLIQDCLRAHEQRLIQRFAPYAALARHGRDAIEAPERIGWLGDGYFADLVTWFHLAWLGETTRRESRVVQRLIARGAGYSHADRLDLARVIQGVLGDLMRRYAALAAEGRVELSTTPWAHPIGPLLLDLNAGREALPTLPVPAASAYPDGRGRLRWHIDAALASFEAHFGRRPLGLWPAEGAVSTAFLRELSGHGLAWIASGACVLRGSSPEAAGERVPHLSGWTLSPDTPVCFFRDDELSDRIGFVYATWHGDDAVADVIERLKDLRAQVRQPERHVAVILMDGENAWEHYPENGFHFLRGLYTQLAAHPLLELTTFARLLAGAIDLRPLPTLRAGSWIYGDLSTWVGAPAKNRAWCALVQAKQAFDAARASGRLAGTRLAEAEEQLAICEGSDWCWWLGSHNSPATIAEFDALYRHQLQGIYRLIGIPAPTVLDTPLDTEVRSDTVSGGTMLPSRRDA